jgi:hypothetical protein
MLEKFVKLLRAELQQERNRTLLSNGRTPALTVERREALVERVRTIEWVQNRIDDILKLREDDVDDDDGRIVNEDDEHSDEPEPTTERPPPRRKPAARNWGA